MALQLQVRASPNAREERGEKEEEEAAKVQAANQIFRLLDWSIRFSSRFWTYFSADPIRNASLLRRRFSEYLDAIKCFISVH